MPTKRVEYESTGFKAVVGENGEPTGEFTADVSVFGNVDLQGDRVMPDAFKAFTAQAKATGDPIPVVWSHQWDEPMAHIGYIDPSNLVSNGKSLRVKGKLDVEDNPVARQVAKLLAQRRVKAWSFAYDVHDESYAKDGANELNALSITEVGPTLKGANPAAQTVMAKALREAADNTKAGRTLSTATVSQLRQIYDWVDQAETLLVNIDNALEGLLGLPDDSATEEMKTVSIANIRARMGLKAKYTAEQLREMLGKGHAMRNANGDPAYPIEDSEDLDNAIHAVGRGGASANAIRKYIMKRARAMDMTDKIPDTWNADGSLKATASDGAKADDGDDENDDVEDGDVTDAEADGEDEDDADGEADGEDENEDENEDDEDTKSAEAPNALAELEQMISEAAALSAESKSQDEEEATKSVLPDVESEEPEAKQSPFVPDAETLLLLHRIEEMRST